MKNWAARNTFQRWSQFSYVSNDLRRRRAILHRVSIPFQNKPTISCASFRESSFFASVQQLSFISSFRNSPINDLIALLIWSSADTFIRHWSTYPVNVAAFSAIHLRRYRCSSFHSAFQSFVFQMTASYEARDCRDRGILVRQIFSGIVNKRSISQFPSAFCLHDKRRCNGALSRHASETHSFHDAQRLIWQLGDATSGHLQRSFHLFNSSNMAHGCWRLVPH